MISVLVCIAKKENRYIREWVEYHKILGFNKIVIYDNNDVNGERFNDVIQDYIDKRFVDIIDFRGKKICQLEAYEHAYKKYSLGYDWLAFFDCDEFLTFYDNTLTINEFLSNPIFEKFAVIHVNWLFYDDNGMFEDDGRPVIDRFLKPHMPISFERKDGIMINSHVKSIIRGRQNNVIPKFINPHTVQYIIGWRCCDPDGFEHFVGTPFNRFFSYKTAYLRHYSLKTIGEYVRNKMKRGFADFSDEDAKSILTLENFFQYNDWTQEKEDYAKKLLEESSEI